MNFPNNSVILYISELWTDLKSDENYIPKVIYQDTML